MSRTIQPELLDTLPPHHPDAQHSRRDLRLINSIMGNHRWLERTLRATVARGERVLELGAGVGELSRRLLRKGVPVDGLDLWPRPIDLPPSLAWHSADLRYFEHYERYDVVLGNLIFHQFDDAQLAALGPALRGHARVLIACEPARRSKSQFLFRTLAPLFGANHVTLHDGRVSIAAGFDNRELPELLGLDATEWSIDCHTTGLGAYHLIAVRRP